MKSMKKLIPAIAMLLVSAVLLGTSTFAWFSMNNKVTVTGMEIHTYVTNNLLIDNYTYVASPLDGNWATDDSTFEVSKTQTITSANVIVPLSTVDAQTFYVTGSDNVKGDGDAKADAYTEVANLGTVTALYSEATGTYIDYHFVLKAQNTTANPQYINLSKLNLIYNGATDTNTAFRIAVLARKFSTATVNGAKTAPGTAAGAGLVTKIYAPAGAVNFTAGEAVNSTSSTGTVTYASAAADATIATVANNATEYYEVVARLWLEGEDKTCNVEVFKGLASGQWALDLEFTLASTQTGVYNINMVKTAVVSATTYYYDGAYVYTVRGDIGDTGADSATAKASASSDVKTAFGIS